MAKITFENAFNESNASKSDICDIWNNIAFVCILNHDVM